MVWPIGGLIQGISTELLVPGQDSPATFTATNGGAGFNCAYAGLRFNITGQLDRRQNTLYNPALSNSWIHSDSWGVVNAADYEMRFTSVTGDTGQMGISDPLNVWISGDTTPEWYVQACGDSFDFEVNSVSGIIQVREKANIANIRSGNVTFQATWEGNF